MIVSSQLRVARAKKDIDYGDKTRVFRLCSVLCWQEMDDRMVTATYQSLSSWFNLVKRMLFKHLVLISRSLLNG